MRTLVTLLALLALASPAPGAVMPVPPVRGPSPLLYVRFSGPAGMNVTFYPGGVEDRRLAAPVKVGLRPGYIYRVRLTELADHPGLALYPSLEVRGSLNLPPQLSVADHPAPVVITKQDIDQVLTGSLITKVIYLENPERAVATTVSPDQPLELDVPATRDPLDEARLYGRPVLIVRLGGRDVTRAELACQSVPGTILLPGDRALMPPAGPPCLPWVCVPCFGGRLPDEECLKDGGDVGRKAGLDAEGQVQGLDPSDTVARYADSTGRLRLVISNRVCLCVPRFAVIRSELPVAGYDTSIALNRAQAVLAQGRLDLRLPSLQAQQNTQLQGAAGQQRPTAAVNAQGVQPLIRVEVLEAAILDLGLAQLIGTQALLTLTDVERTMLIRRIEFARELSRTTSVANAEQQYGVAVAGRVIGLDTIHNVVETRDLTVCCGEEPRPPEKPLVLCKWASTHSAQIGDVVTFYLKYSNHGGRPITDIAVSDSLTGRLEYVPGSAQSDRNAVFTTQENEAGSLLLRWEISGKLLPGQSGVVKFQARIR